jgi:tRNA-splicing ligase RtcB
MDVSSFERISECAWRIPAVADMRVPVVIYASEQLAHDMDEKVREQAVNVAMLPGIVQAVYVMPDAHWGYGFPIGGVAAFEAGKAVWSRPGESASIFRAVYGR